MQEKYSVVQFFEDGSYEYVRTNVEAAEAMKAAAHYTSSMGVALGFVKRVIITDMGDCICFEWIHGQGVVFPPKSPANTEK